ncbi:S-formylglutathione hydrolase FrmB [Micromonospora palomenae]|uniref:Acyl-CoA:diacylglycerol acyltransferase n=1 Tax=Micromonospora palomenae TaxID=1461247 RepID=A0A561WUI6_9ACTN|nr:alpha/beta hydrolase-fold protein [Micromonospora palomenae]TWG27515.1 S-formylglutathione hydrolase FrmB [Micromonospora palomenae]
MPITRRRALAWLGVAFGAAATCAGGAALVDAAVLPGRSVLNQALGRCAAADPARELRATPGPSVSGTFRSPARRREVAFALSYPPGYAPGARLPVCLALHGYASDAAAAVRNGDYPAFIAGAVRAGAAPFVLAAVDGGDGYWHPHPDDDPLTMLTGEFLPLLASRGLRTDRVAVAGWSMGGYGALLCALTRPELFRAVVATSPAIFHSYADARAVNPGAYDSAGEWDRYDVLARAREFAGLPLRVAIGAADPFTPAVRAWRDRLPDPEVVRISTGCHDGRFWTSVAPEQVRAISVALAG